MARKKTRRTRVSAEDFVRAYKKGGTPQQVADRAGMTRNTLYRRVHQLKKLGVKLPKLDEGRWHAKINVVALNKLLGDARALKKFRKARVSRRKK